MAVVSPFIAHYTAGTPRGRGATQKIHHVQAKPPMRTGSVLDRLTYWAAFQTVLMNTSVPQVKLPHAHYFYWRFLNSDKRALICIVLGIACFRRAPQAADTYRWAHTAGAWCQETAHQPVKAYKYQNLGPQCLATAN